MTAEVLPGFAWGFVHDNKDPLNLGRAKISITGLFDAPAHPEWALPIGWPGAGGLDKGSRYPVKVGDQVIVFFEHGNIYAPPVYLPGAYGRHPQFARPGGPIDAAIAPTLGKDANNITTLWEDDSFTLTMTRYDAGQQPERRLSFTDSAGNGLVINAADGANGKSVTVELIGRTAVTIQSEGVVKIEGRSVQINGRKVLRKPGNTSI